MIEIKSNDLWLELENLFANSTSIKAAVAYVSDDSCLSFGKNDILVVDASDSSIAGARTSATVLKAAYEKGAKLYSCNTLHGKVIVFDKKAYIGSANISKNAKNRLDEVGIITDQPAIISGATQFIDALKNKSTIIDQEFIDKISKIDVSHGNLPSKQKTKKIQIETPRTWLISISNDSKYPGNETKVEEDNKSIKTKNDDAIPTWFWLKKGKKCRFYEQVKINDILVTIEREKQKSNEPEYAYRHSVVQKITSETEKNVKSYHYTTTEDDKISWSIFQEIAKTANILGLGTGLNTIRELKVEQSDMLFKLWN